MKSKYALVLGIVLAAATTLVGSDYPYFQSTGYWTNAHDVTFTHARRQIQGHIYRVELLCAQPDKDGYFLPGSLGLDPGEYRYHAERAHSGSSTLLVLDDGSGIVCKVDSTEAE